MRIAFRWAVLALAAAAGANPESTVERFIDLTSGSQGVGDRGMGQNPRVTLPGTRIVE